MSREDRGIRGGFDDQTICALQEERVEWRSYPIKSASVERLWL